MKARFIILFLVFPILVFAQKADIRIGELLNKSDWFTLVDEYTALKDSIQTPFLKTMAEAMIYQNFNQPEKAIDAINELLTLYKNEIGEQNVINFTALKSRLLAEMGRYKESAETAKFTLLLRF